MIPFSSKSDNASRSGRLARSRQSSVRDRRRHDFDFAEVFQTPQVRQSGVGDLGIKEMERSEPIEVLDRGEIVVGRLVAEEDLVRNWSKITVPKSLGCPILSLWQMRR